MIGIIGTVPDQHFPLTHGRVQLDGDHLEINGRRIAVNRGTPALLGAAVTAAEQLDAPDIHAFLVGDIGKGEGSRALHGFLEKELDRWAFQVLTFHYLQPDVDWHNRVMFAIERLPRRPLLIADAGFMYAAKMSGQAPAYDFFTPDAGELAFLADETAPHPFYTRGFILHQDNKVPELIRRAGQHGNAARHMLVKGATDYIVAGDRIAATVDRPGFDAMEAIGGTGDTLTGLLTVLCGAGYTPTEAAELAARTNRRSGLLADPDPATQIAELIAHMPKALSSVLDEFAGPPRPPECPAGFR